MATSEEEEEKSRSNSFVAEDLLDYESVELFDEDINDIMSIQRLSDSAADKLIFTIFLLNVMTTSFLVGYVPHYFYYWHTVKSITLLLFRWYSYKSKGWHYFLFDFCYYTHFLVLVYFWSPWKPSFLFPVIFIFTNGPLLWAIALWRNSVVPHSIDKMTSLFIHVSPALATWGIRWHSSPEQDFVLCIDQTLPGPEGCDHVGVIELLLWPIVCYMVWMSCYVMIVLIWRKERVSERKYTTSVTWMTERVKKGFMYKLFIICGEKYRKQIYFLWQSIYIGLGIASAYASFHWMAYGMASILLMMLAACYNGATFYIDVIGLNRKTI